MMGILRALTKRIPAWLALAGTAFAGLLGFLWSDLNEFRSKRVEAASEIVASANEVDRELTELLVKFA
jgi:hypothetical protein